MCYTIYLLHGMIISQCYRATKHVTLSDDFTINVLTQLVLLVPIVLLVSGAYFLAIERPCMRRDWPSRIWSALFRPRAQVSAAQT